MTRLIQVQLATVQERCFLGKLNKTYLSLFLIELKTYHLSYYIHKTWRYWHCWPSTMQYAGRVKYELRMGPLTTVSAAQWLTGQSAELDERFNSSWGLPCPSFVPRSWQDEKTSSYISLPSSKLTILLILFINPLIPEWPAFNFSFQCHPWIKHQSHENKGNDN